MASSKKNARGEHKANDAFFETVGRVENFYVQKSRVVRRPLALPLDLAAKLLNKSNHDRIYHLYHESYITENEDGSGKSYVIRMDRTQRLNAAIVSGGSLAKGERGLSVSPHERPTKLREVLNRSVADHIERGVDFEKYSVRDNNCQLFVQSLLRGPDRQWTPQVKAFVNQNIGGDVVPEFLGKRLDKVTTLARDLDI